MRRRKKLYILSSQIWRFRLIQAEVFSLGTGKSTEF